MKKIFVLFILLILCFALISCSGTTNCKMISYSSNAVSGNTDTIQTTFTIRLKYKSSYFDAALSEPLQVFYTIDDDEKSANLYGEAIVSAQLSNNGALVYNLFKPNSYVYFRFFKLGNKNQQEKSFSIKVVVRTNSKVLDTYEFTIKYKV